MAEIIEMPKLSDTMEEGGVANWLIKEGEFVEDGAPLVEIETDKATMEYNSPEEGTLLKILVQAGSTCALNAPIAIIGEKGEQFDLDQLMKGSGAAQEASKKAEAPAQAAPEPTPIKAAPTSGGRHRSSPLARKVAEDMGIDITSLTGTGPKGRVVLRDVTAAPAPAAAPLTAPAPAAAAMPNAPAATAPVAAPSGGVYEDIPVTMMRKTIAKRLLAGKNEAPHFYLTVSADMSRLLAWRKELNAEAAAQEGIQKVSVNDLIVLAATKALVKHPEVNSSWQTDHIRRFHSVHMAVAVALPEGLITPVVRDAERLGVRDIGAKTKELVKKAKSGQLAPEDYTGGTFTISNLGMMGIEEFTAIINPPQAAILAVGATIPTPSVGPEGEIKALPKMKMTLSCDHRVVDGAMGASFLQTLVRYLENPLKMLT